jgi:hypothetical protein
MLSQTSLLIAVKSFVMRAASNCRAVTNMRLCSKPMVREPVPQTYG